MDRKETYIAPEITVVKCRVERGFTGSQINALIFSRYLETYDTKATWGADAENNHFFD